MKTILITGAGKNLGKCLAEHWLQKGWRVIGHFNTVNELAEHPHLVSLQADLSDRNQLDTLCQSLSQYGPYDAVIHNASCFVADLAAAKGHIALDEHFDRHFSVHVLAPILITDRIKKLWADSAWMTVITDIYADIPNENYSVYCASKAALQNWAISSAQRFADKVRVNIIQPGPIQFLPEHDQAYREKVLSQSLIKAELGYQAVVDACDYLAGSRAVSGTVMRVDGGRFVANRYNHLFS